MMDGSSREGYISDYATGKPVDIRKPEEKVRQQYERTLCLDYGYDCGQLDIEVYIQRGSRPESPARRTRRTRSDRADIVIYRSQDVFRRDQHSEIMGIVETKRPTRTEGVKQLSGYMTATSARWGVWTNGDEIEYLYKDPESGEVRRNFIFQIPRSGESVEDMGQITKDSLVAATDLKTIFRRMLKTLYANTNISRREKLGSEMIRLIFAKIWDERYDQERVPRFRIGFDDGRDEVKDRVQQLFSEVKKELVADGVFDRNEEITLDATSVMWVVGQLQQYSLLKTDKDAVGDAFEVFAESKLVGEKGEFFTPREVVRTAVALVNPQPQESIADPACGSGGFLIHALEYVWQVMDESPRFRSSPDLLRMKQQYAERYFFGIDKEIDLVKIAKAYMAIVGDGRGGIVQENSLHEPAEWQGRARDLFVVGSGFRQFDVIFTNPPFGSSIKVLPDQAAQFELGHVWRRDGVRWVRTAKVKDTEPQVLFVERCLQMLKDGGRLAIVLPETFFHADATKYVLEYMKSGNNIQAVVDLSHNTFRPHNNAKTVLLVLQKGCPQQNDILMAVAEETGHDHQGRIAYRFDPETGQRTEEVWDDTVVIRDQLRDPWNAGNTHVFMVGTSDITNDIYVPRYYWVKRIQGIISQANDQYEFVPVQALLDEGIIEAYSGHGSPPSEYKGRGSIPYIRVADIVNWEMYKNPTTPVPEDIYESVKGRTGVNLQARDIIFVRRGSYRIGTVAMVSPLDTKVLLTRELVVIRVVKPENKYGVDPFYLLYLLSHKLTQDQLYQKVLIDTTLPNIADRWTELQLPVLRDKDVARSLAARIQGSFELKWKAQEDIQSLRVEFGDVTT